MSVTVGEVASLRLGQDDHDRDWMVYAGTLLLVLGCVNIIDGIAAVNGSDFFLSRAHYIFGDLSAWGWVIWLVGIAQGLAACGVLLKNQSARWFGVAFAFLNALAQLLMIEAYPFLSLALLSLDIVVIYGLVVHGSRTYRPA